MMSQECEVKKEEMSLMRSYQDWNPGPWWTIGDQPWV
jgi:hypothetical protein